MMSQPTLVELARLGNADAIATLMNRSLQPKGITAKASIKGDCLRVMLESQQVPNKPTLVKLIQQGLTKLNIESIKTVKIYGKQSGQDFPVWHDNLSLIIQNQPVSHSKAYSESITTNSSAEISLVKPNQDTSVSNETESEQTKSVESTLETSKANSSVPKTKHGFKQFLYAITSYKVWGRVLLILLGLRLSFDILFLFYSLTWATSYYFLDFIDAVDSTRILASLAYALYKGIDVLGSILRTGKNWIYLFTVIITLIWLHRLHAQLRAIFKGYPITPWGAIARYIIPVYSLWGIWNLFSTLARKLKSQSGELVRLGFSLQRRLPWLYISLISSSIFHLIYRFQTREMYTSGVSILIYVVNNILNLFVALILLQIVMITTKAIAEKVKQKAV